MTADHRHILEALLAAIDGVAVGESAFGSGDGYWAGGKEIAHFDAEDVVDIRLTRAEIRARRTDLRADARVTLRASSSADWLEVRVCTADDVEFAAALVEIAAAAHRGAPGQVGPPPRGADLARRRRFH